MSTPQCTANHRSGRTYDVVIPQVGNSANFMEVDLGKGGLLFSVFTNIIFIASCRIYVLNKQIHSNLHSLLASTTRVQNPVARNQLRSPIIKRIRATKMAPNKGPELRQ